MAKSRRNFICITESGKVEKYASQSIRQILDEKESYTDEYVTIIDTGLHSPYDDGFEELHWYD